MAGLTLSAGVFAILGIGTPAIPGQPSGNAEAAKPEPPRVAAKDEKATEKPEAKRPQPVMLMLKIAGLGADGCDVEIKPANPTCRFRPVKRHVGTSGLHNELIKDMEVRGMDRNISVAITVSEPGQRSRTILRGFRMAARPTDQASETPVESFDCWLSSPSKLARLEESTTRK